MRLQTLGVLVLLLAACAGGEEAAPAGAGEVHTYQVRGLIQSLPDPESDAGQLFIRHEAIPDLVGQSGEVEGMAAMTMPFPVDSQIDLVGFATGDPVRFTLRVDWQAARPVVVTAMEKLPADTELTFD